VDHSGRCCKVKWFRTYTEGSNPQPIYVSTSDASVYDLKDHPDFKFRPGSIVIRVMNSAGEDCGLGAGQVLDNSPSGQVSVWWAGDEGGVKSCCWPQDLYRVGEYDSDEGELWYDDDDEESDDGNESWETEEEVEQVGDEKIEDATEESEEIKNKLAVKIEKARIAMGRLELELQWVGWRRFLFKIQISRLPTFQGNFWRCIETVDNLINLWRLTSFTRGNSLVY